MSELSSRALQNVNRDSLKRKFWVRFQHSQSILKWIQAKYLDWSFKTFFVSQGKYWELFDICYAKQMDVLGFYAHIKLNLMKSFKRKVNRVFSTLLLVPLPFYLLEIRQFITVFIISLDRLGH
jgi:hypothetical protein